MLAVGHVTLECWEVLQTYWSETDRKRNQPSEYVFPSNGGHISRDRANDALKNAWLRAYPDRKDAKIRFHQLRKYKSRVLTDAGVNELAVKRTTGKKVPITMLVYLRDMDLKRAFTRAINMLRLTGVSLENQNQETEALKKEVAELKKMRSIIKPLADSLIAYFNEKGEEEMLKKLKREIKKTRI